MCMILFLGLNAYNCQLEFLVLEVGLLLSLILGGDLFYILSGLAGGLVCS